MASKSYGWDVRNIAKINPKMVKKGPFFDFRKKPKPTPLPHMRLWYKNRGSNFLKIKNNLETFFRKVKEPFSDKTSLGENYSFQLSMSWLQSYT